jgi:TP901 family phage tail tape measure protein
MAKKKKVTYWFGADITEFERKVKNLDRRLYRLSDSIGKYGMAFTKSLTAPLTAMGMIATKAALNVEKALSDIARGTGASGAALKGLEKDWKALAGKVDDSFETSAKVLADYNTRLGLTGTALQEISKQALDAAGMLGEEVNSVVMESAKAMQDWGVASSEMAGYMDKIFVASQQTGVSMAGLATNMYKYGSALRQMGFDADAAIATLAQFDKQGVNTELVMGSLRIALGKMAKAGITDASEAFKVLTDQIKNAKTPTEGTRLAIELFGSRAGPDMAAAIREGRFELGNLTEALNTSRGAIEKADAATETFVERWGEVKNQVQIAIEPIGKAILKVADSYIPTLQNKVNELTDTINNMSQESIDSMLKWAGIMAAGGPVLLGMAAIIASARTILGLFTAMMAHPAIAAGAGLAAAAYAGYNFLKKDQQDAKEVMRKLELEKKGLPTGMNSLAAAKLADGKVPPVVVPIPKVATPTATPTAATAMSVSKGGSKGSSTATETALERQIKLAQQAGQETAFAIERMQKQEELQKEVMLAVQEGEAKFNEEMATLATDDARAALNALKLQVDIGNISFEQYRDGLEQLKTQFDGMPGAITEIDNAMKALDSSILASTRTLGSFVREAETALKDKLVALPDALSGAFAGAIAYGEDLGDTLKSLAKDIAYATIKAFLLKSIFGAGGIGSIFGGFANGGVFNASGVTAFASGGIVNKPTLFPFANGIGLMGEAGAEAIMPLKRTSSGDLGVQAEGGGGTTNITMNINAVDSQSFVQMLRNNKAAVESLVIENIYRNGSVRKAIQQGV